MSRKTQEELKILRAELNLKYVTNNDKKKWIGKIFKSNNYGEFKIIDAVKKNKDGSTYYLCEFTNTKYLIIAHKHNIVNGNVLDRYAPTIFNVGIIGDIIESDVKKHPYYKLWWLMLHRSYSENFKNKFPTYKDVIVSDTWLTFTKFIEDVPKIIGFKEMIKYNNKYIFNLDKDILIHNNKIYDLNNCCLIPEKLNSFFINKQITNITGYEGVGLNKGKFRARISIDNKQRYIGQFTNPLDAYIEYHKNKELALKYYLNNEFNFIDNLIKERMYIKLQKQYEDTLNVKGVKYEKN